MPDYSRRYHNVFHAYRGMASGDPIGEGPRQLEQNVTRALLITLEHAGPQATSRFIQQLGRSRVDADAFSYDLEVVHRQPDGSKVILLGLSPEGRVTPGSVRSSGGQSRVDAVLEAPGRIRVLIESKLVGGCDGDQLWRHALAWGQAEPQTVGGRVRLPENWVMRSWEDVRSWAVGERGAADVPPVGDFLLGELADYLVYCGVAGTIERPARKSVADLPVPPLAPAADLAVVREVCRTLYGNGGPNHVTGPACRADMATVIEQCRRNGAPVPPGLLNDAKGGVITPRRALSILYGRDRYEQTVLPQSDVTGARKHLERGMDRAVLLGVLAWAGQAAAPFRNYAIRMVARAWDDAPVQTAVAPELTAALRARGVTW